MAKLKASGRAKIPTSKFGVPSKAKTASAKKRSGNFPVEDKAHARAALALIGHASPAERPGIRAKAKKMLGTSKKKKSK